MCAARRCLLPANKAMNVLHVINGDGWLDVHSAWVLWSGSGGCSGRWHAGAAGAAACAGLRHPAWVSQASPYCGPFHAPLGLR